MLTKWKWFNEHMSIQTILAIGLKMELHITLRQGIIVSLGATVLLVVFITFLHLFYAKKGDSEQSINAKEIIFSLAGILTLTIIALVLTAITGVNNNWAIMGPAIFFLLAPYIILHSK